MPTARELLEQVDALMRRNRALEAAAARGGTAAAGPLPHAAPAAADDVPVLTEAMAAPEGALVAAPAAPATAGPGPADEVPLLTEAVAPTLAEARALRAEAAAAAAAAAPDAPPAAPAIDDEARWRAIAADIELQVLQRLDIFTDAGLQQQLAARLQPIVDRASAELVATISRQVGQLLRSYVAEAVEREIDQWRQGGN